jgi:hypothetical protein
MDVAHSHGCVVQGLLKTQALPAAPNATVGHASSGLAWRLNTPPGGACGGRDRLRRRLRRAFRPEGSIGFSKNQALPAAPNATVGYACLDWLGVSKPRRAAPAAAVIASGGAGGGRVDHLSQV